MEESIRIKLTCEETTSKIIEALDPEKVKSLFIGYVPRGTTRKILAHRNPMALALEGAFFIGDRMVVL